MFNQTQYKNYKDMAIKSPAFIQGVKDFKSGSVKMKGEPFLWVKQLVSSKDYERYYKHNHAYRVVGRLGGIINEKTGKRTGGKIKIAYRVAKRFGVPMNCELLSDDEYMILVSNNQI